MLHFMISIQKKENNVWLSRGKYMYYHTLKYYHVEVYDQHQQRMTIRREILAHDNKNPCSSL